jgi:asparagine synthase (glutamine-hydrolysing)
VTSMPELEGMAGHGEGYFVVLPDREATSAVASLLHGSGVRTLTHASGRPWLVGRWGDDEITAVTAGNTRLAVLGCCPVSPASLAREAERLRDVADLDRLARTLPGSFHLVAAVQGRLRVQGSASGLRLVFFTTVAGVTVAADRADLLARLTAAELDERQVAVRLLWPVPHPLLNTPLWSGVAAVAAENYLIIEQEGRTSRQFRWWTPPEPTRSLADNAPLLREALTAAVDARTSSGGVVSCDLSGGLDSTSICFLSAAGSARVIASTWPGLDPGDDDLAWARRAAAHLPDVEHVIWSAHESPLVYEGLLDIDDPLDEPTIGMMDRARVLSHLPRMLAMGSRLHFTGIGGDHVTWCSEAHYHTILRRHPRFALRQLRGFRALFHWSLGAMTRALADTRSYRQWLANAVDDLRGGTPESGTVALDWGMAPRLFDWVTPQAWHAAREVISEAAETAEPLAPTRGEHVDLEQIRDTTRILRQWNQMSARIGLPMASPFLDDRVIEVCLAVRPEERVTPWRYKPLLVAGMRGVVADECLERTSKAQAALDAAAGLRKHRGDLLALWENSRLAQLGLVDADQLRALAQRPDTPGLRHAILYSTIGCEVWLRALETSHTASLIGRS